MTVQNKPWAVWPITEHPSRGSQTERFKTKEEAVTRSFQLATDGDAWLIGVFNGWDDGDFAAYQITAISFDGSVYEKR